MIKKRKLLFFSPIILCLYSAFTFAQLSKSSPFIERKNFISFSKTSSTRDALALVKAECLKSKELLPLWLQDEVPKHIPESMSARAVKFSLERVSKKQIDLETGNPCILGFGDNLVAKTASFNDPQFKDQLFYSYSHFPKFASTFKSPTFKPLTPVIVAVIDSGVSLSHPEFLGKLWIDGEGHFGYNFLEDDFNVEDEAGHGSHVSGLITANSDNGIGVVGVSQSVKLMTLKTQGIDGKGSVGDVADAIRYATDRGADVINLSLTIGADSPFIKDAVDYALERGVVLVSASGNNGVEITESQFISPAGLAPDRPGLISVGSVDSSTGELSFFSNYSSDYVELSAPGSHGLEHILSTYKNGRYFALAGTSMAAPQVTGAVAQIISYLKSYQVNYDPALIESLVLKGTRTNAGLTGFIKEGREIDFKKLSRVILKRYHLSSDGGVNE